MGQLDQTNWVAFAGVGLTAPDGSVIPSDAVPRSWHGDSNINYHDPALMTLEFDGVKWDKSPEREMPWFLLIHSDGTFQGQPCWHWRQDLSTYNWGEVWAGQLVRIKNVDKEVTQLGVPLMRIGNAEDDLYYEIRDSGERVLREGVLAKKEDISPPDRGIGFAWCYADFEPFVLQKGQAYRVVIKTPKTTFKGGRIATDVGGCLRYRGEVYTNLYPEYALTSYDGTDSMFTLSLNGGKTWTMHPCRDMSFGLKLKETLSGSVTSAAKDAEQVSGPGARWKSIAFQGETCRLADFRNGLQRKRFTFKDDTPGGTSVDIFVSSSADNKAWSDFVPVKEGARSGQSYVLPAERQKRYMRWRLALKTNDAKVSPKLTQVEAVAVLRKERN